MFMTFRSWFNHVFALSLLMSSSACSLEAGEDFAEKQEALSAATASDRASLALRWAPIHYQDVDQTGSHALGGAADYIARYDFDGDLDARNNWDRAGNS